MNEMIEQVARAMAEAEGDSNDPVLDYWKWRARDAIRAMREPTDEMIDAFWAEEEKQMQGAKGGGREMFIAAIEAALTNGE